MSAIWSIGAANPWVPHCKLKYELIDVATEVL
jgi:hypothetical protein